jgi:hypothetical protein
MAGYGGFAGVSDLGLGSALSQQTEDESDEEKKRKRVLGLGLGSAGMGTPQVTSAFGAAGFGGGR